MLGKLRCQMLFNGVDIDGNAVFRDYETAQPRAVFVGFSYNRRIGNASKLSSCPVISSNSALAV